MKAGMLMNGIRTKPVKPASVADRPAGVTMIGAAGLPMMTVAMTTMDGHRAEVFLTATVAMMKGAIPIVDVLLTTATVGIMVAAGPTATGAMVVVLPAWTGMKCGE